MKDTKKKNNTGKILLILLLVVILVAAVALLAGKGQKAPSEETVQTITATVETEAFLVTVPTPYADITYPAAFADVLICRVSEASGVKAEFLTEIQEGEVPLFDILFDSEEGDLLGYLPYDEILLPVTVVVHEILPGENWTKDDEMQAQSLQEVLNDVIGGFSFEELPQAEIPMESLQTPYGMLTYPNPWGGALRMEVTNEDCCIIRGFGTVESGEAYHLFDISFGGTGENLAGLYLEAEGKVLEVWLTMPELPDQDNWTDNDRIAITGMRNLVNDLVEQLKLQPKPEEKPAAPKTVTVDTPFGVLTCLDSWNGGLRVNVSADYGCLISAYGVSAGKGEKQLYEIAIGRSGETLLGYVEKDGQSYAVHLTMKTLTAGQGWSQEEIDVFLAMQNTANDLLDQLPVREAAETEVPEETKDGSISIVTAYGSLYYPEKWRNNLRYAVTGNDTYVISFYGTVLGQKEIHLFDILLGAGGETYLGTLTNADGVAAEVYLTTDPFEPDENWTEEQRTTIFQMQEDVNYVIDKLMERENFEN